MCNHGAICKFIGHDNNNEGDCYHRRNPVTNRASKTQDVIFLQFVFYQGQNIDQFMKKSADEYQQVMNGLSEGAVLLTKRAAKNPKRTQEEVHEGLLKLAKTEEETLRASTDYLATVANGLEGWYVCIEDQSWL